MSAHGVHGNVWGSVKYSVCSAIRKVCYTITIQKGNFPFLDRFRVKFCYGKLMVTATTSMKNNLTISKYNSHDSRQNVTFAKKFRRCKGKKTSLLFTIKGLVNIVLLFNETNHHILSRFPRDNWSTSQ
jgi:hypothetical protein